MNFKKTLLASLLMISASGAFAAESATLSVTGTIAPTACTVELNGTSSAEVVFDVPDYVGAAMTLEPKTIPFSITCNPNALAVTFAPVDNTEPSPAISSFSLGRVGAGLQIGRYTMTMDATTADSNASRLIYRPAADTVWQVSNNGNNLAQDNTFAFANTSALEPVMARNFSANMIITPTIAANLPTDDAIELQGSTTITITQI